MKKTAVWAVACLTALALTLPGPATAGTGGGQVTLEGSVGTGTPQIISVTMPYRVLFSVQTKADGTVEEVIGVEATVTNNSNCAVSLQITKVADPGGLLEKVNLALAAKSVGADAALQNGKLTLGDSLSIDLLTLARGAQEKVTVFGKAVDADPVIETGSYTVTPTITVTAAP